MGPSIICGVDFTDLCCEIGLGSSPNRPNLVTSSDWHRVIAAQRKIVETRGVSIPSRHIYRIAANDVRRSAHLDPTLAGSTFEKGHFQFDCSARRNHTGGQEVDTTRTDIAGHERDGKGFGQFSHSKEPHRQRQCCTGCAATIFYYTNSVGRDARKAARAGFTRWRWDTYSAAFKTA
jgi:hypothetical protein